MKTTLLVYLILTFLLSSSIANKNDLIGFCATTRKDEPSNIDINCDETKIIAIHEAYFTTAHTTEQRCPFLGKTFTIPHQNNEHYIHSKHTATENSNQFNKYGICEDDIRATMNARCSGKKSCSLNLTKDETGVRCLNGDGDFVFRYACIDKKEIANTCNVKLNKPYAYISTPNYPDFYVKYNCSWTIKADPGQQIQVSILDVDIYDQYPIYERIRDNRTYKTISRCNDSLTISDGKKSLLQTCERNSRKLRTLKINSSQVHIDLKSSEFRNYRGALLYYNLIGCSKMRAPTDATKMFQNETTSIYVCNDGYIFERSKVKEIVFRCTDNNGWLPYETRCIAKNSETSKETGPLTPLTDNLEPAEQKESAKGGIIIGSSASSGSSNERNSDNTGSTSSDGDDDDGYFSSILVPLIILSTLIIGNVIILWIILKFKKKRDQTAKQKENALIPMKTDETVNV